MTVLFACNRRRRDQSAWRDQGTWLCVGDCLSSCCGVVSLEWTTGKFFFSTFQREKIARWQNDEEGTMFVEGGNIPILCQTRFGKKSSALSYVRPWNLFFQPATNTLNRNLFVKPPRYTHTGASIKKRQREWPTAQRVHSLKATHQTMTKHWSIVSQRQERHLHL